MRTAPQIGRDYVGIVFGVALAVVGVLALLVGGLLLALTFSGRRRADRGWPGRLLAAGVVAIVLGSGSAVAAVAGLVSSGGSGVPGVVAALGGALLLLIPGGAIVRVTRAGAGPHPGPTTRDLPGR